MMLCITYKDYNRLIDIPETQTKADAFSEYTEKLLNLIDPMEWETFVDTDREDFVVITRRPINAVSRPETVFATLNIC